MQLLMPYITYLAPRGPPTPNTCHLLSLLSGTSRPAKSMESVPVGAMMGPCWGQEGGLQAAVQKLFFAPSRQKGKVYIIY